MAPDLFEDFHEQQYLLDSLCQQGGAFKGACSNLMKAARQDYGTNLEAKLREILTFCYQHQVHLVVFPEYAIPTSAIGVLRDFSTDMAIVAGLGFLRQEDITNLEKIALEERERGFDGVEHARHGCNAAVLLSPQTNALVIKKHSAGGEHMEQGTGPQPFSLEFNDHKYNIAVAICKDFLREKELIRSYSPNLVHLVAIPSLSRSRSEFREKPRDFARIFANHAQYGGTYIGASEIKAPCFVDGDVGTDPLPAGSEGIVVVDWDLGRAESRITPFDLTEHFLYARAGLVYKGLNLDNNPTVALSQVCQMDAAEMIPKEDAVHLAQDALTTLQSLGSDLPMLHDALTDIVEHEEELLDDEVDVLRRHCLLSDRVLTITEWRHKQCMAVADALYDQAQRSQLDVPGLVWAAIGVYRDQARSLADGVRVSLRRFGHHGPSAQGVGPVGEEVEQLVCLAPREEEERRNRLDELYAQARQSHRAQEWQAVVDILDQIQAEDPEYPDSEGLLASACEELKQALEGFEEVQRLKRGYQDSERPRSRVSREPAYRTERERPDNVADPTDLTESRSTSPWEYVDLELEIRQGDRSKYPVVVRSARGEEVREEMHFPFDERQLEDKLENLEKAVLLSSTKRRRIRLPERQIVQDFGKALFQALFGGQVGTYYYESLRKAKRRNKGLRLKLRIQPPELAMLPWEFLYDPGRDQYLSLSSKTPLVRCVDPREPVEQLPVTPPIRILGMVASPHDLPRLEVEKEKRRVKEAVKDLEAKGRVELTWLEGQTWRDLLRAMRRGSWHIFHFIGHGDFDPDNEEGLIALTDEGSNAHFFRAENLAELLKDHWDLRLVLLNSCEGARGSEHDAFSSMAAALVRPGIPAVLANQYEISDEAAVEFSRAFYEAVADGLPLDAAVAGARISLKIEIENTLEWVTPVLYLQSSDGRIFDVQKEDPEGEEDSKEEEDSLSRYRECVESAWADGELHEREVEWLSDYVNNKLGLSPDTTAVIECEIMGDTKEVILERHERAAKEKYRKATAEEWTNRKHAQAHRAHQAQEWQAIGEVFDQIRAVEPASPDPEGLLASAREALEQTPRVADIYNQGLRHMDAGEWSQALRCFEEVQRLEPSYRQIETLLSQVRHALADRTEGGRRDDSGEQEYSRGGKRLSTKPSFLPGERKLKSVRPQELPP
jgi:hypothetical protein